MKQNKYICWITCEKLIENHENYDMLHLCLHMLSSPISSTQKKLTRNIKEIACGLTIRTGTENSFLTLKAISSWLLPVRNRKEGDKDRVMIFLKLVIVWLTPPTISTSETADIEETWMVIPTSTGLSPYLKIYNDQIVALKKTDRMSNRLSF